MFNDAVISEAKPPVREIVTIQQIFKHIDGETLQSGLLEKMATAFNVHVLLCAGHILSEYRAH